MEEKVNADEINKLFDKAVLSFYTPTFEEKSYKRFQKVIEKDPKFRTNDSPPYDNPYFYMGRYHDSYCGDFEAAKECYTKWHPSKVLYTFFAHSPFAGAFFKRL